MKNREEIKKEIHKLIKEYYEVAHKKEDYKIGDKISYGGRTFNEKEIINLVDASLEFWLTSGIYTKEFEYKLGEFLKVDYCHSCNSGSSANLLAFMALTSTLLGEKRILPGDEVITVAAGFPTTISPIIQYGAIPVFLDVTIPQYNIDYNLLEEALTQKTKAVIIAHTLGNPFNLRKVKEFCDKYSLWLIEDNCDALGSMYNIDGEYKYTGSIGDIGTSSFYPPHHMTTGEGGAVYTNNPLLSKIILSLRDWGRDCVCPSGVDNICKNRFSKQYGELPFGYDHKYVYSHFGYNLKLTDLQAAIGCEQLNKLNYFIDERRNNWNYIRESLKNNDKTLILPESEENSIPSWFGFLITVREECNFSRDKIVKYLEDKNIQTRMLFAGNIIKHPCFNEMRSESKGYRVVGDLNNTNFIMNNSFWIGVYPGMTKAMIDYMVSSIKEFINNYS